MLSGGNEAFAIYDRNGNLKLGPISYQTFFGEPATTNRIDTGDDRLLGATFRYGSIYTANTTGTVSPQLSSSPNAYANVQWYQITPTSLTTSSASSAAVANPSVAYFFPGVQPVCGTPCTTPWFWS